MNSYAADQNSTSTCVCHYHYHYDMGKPDTTINTTNVYQEYPMGDGWIKLVCLVPPNTSSNPTTNWTLKDYDYHEDWVKEETLNTTSPFKEPLVKPTLLEVLTPVKHEVSIPDAPVKPGVSIPEEVPIEIKIEKTEPDDIPDLELGPQEEFSPLKPRVLEPSYYEEKEDGEYSYSEESTYTFLEKPGPSEYYYINEPIEFFKDGKWYLGKVASNYGDSLEYFDIEFVNNFGNDSFLYEISRESVRKLTKFKKDLLVEVLWYGEWYEAIIVSDNDEESTYVCPDVKYVDSEYYGYVEEAINPNRIRFLE